MIPQEDVRKKKKKVTYASRDEYETYLSKLKEKFAKQIEIMRKGLNEEEFDSDEMAGMTFNVRTYDGSYIDVQVQPTSDPLKLIQYIVDKSFPSDR